MTSLDLVRLNVRDDVAPYTFSDPVVTAILANYGNDVNMASSHLWLLRAGDAAKRNFKFKESGREVDKTATAKECREQAAFFRDFALTTPADGVAEITWTKAFDPPEEG